MASNQVSEPSRPLRAPAEVAQGAAPFHTAARPFSRIARILPGCGPSWLEANVEGSLWDEVPLPFRLWH